MRQRTLGILAAAFLLAGAALGAAAGIGAYLAGGPSAAPMQRPIGPLPAHRGPGGPPRFQPGFQPDGTDPGRQ